MESDAACCNCKYWMPFPGKPEGQGECRRYAPHPPAVLDSTKWPKTMGADWCGEHEPKVAKS